MDLQEFITQLPGKAKMAEKENKQFFQKLKKQKPKKLDETVQALHQEVFEDIDCLECANCCKTTSPLFKQKDIERLAKHFKMSPGAFIDIYLHIDEDGDYVFNEAPCPFLAPDNYCMVYDHRPNACREYPHTDQRKFHQVLNITVKNTAICPAVYNIVERLKTVI